MLSFFYREPLPSWSTLLPLFIKNRPHTSTHNTSHPRSLSTVSANSITFLLPCTHQHPYTSPSLTPSLSPIIPLPSPPPHPTSLTVPPTPHTTTKPNPLSRHRAITGSYTSGHRSPYSPLTSVLTSNVCVATSPFGPGDAFEGSKIWDKCLAQLLRGMLPVRRTRNEGWFEEVEALTCDTVVPGVGEGIPKIAHSCCPTSRLSTVLPISMLRDECTRERALVCFLRAASASASRAGMVRDEPSA